MTVQMAKANSKQDKKSLEMVPQIFSWHAIKDEGGKSTYKTLYSPSKAKSPKGGDAKPWV